MFVYVKWNGYLYSIEGGTLYRKWPWGPETQSPCPAGIAKESPVWAAHACWLWWAHICIVCAGVGELSGWGISVVCWRWGACLTGFGAAVVWGKWGTPICTSKLEEDCQNGTYLPQHSRGWVRSQKWCLATIPSLKGVLVASCLSGSHFN